ncbi:pol polyprotein [Tanacetum coccineum]
MFLPPKVFTFMSKCSPKFSGKLTPLTPPMLEVATAVRAAHSLHTEELDIPTSSHHSDDSSAGKKAESPSPVASERSASPNDYTPQMKVEDEAGPSTFQDESDEFIQGDTLIADILDRYPKPEKDRKLPFLEEPKKKKKLTLQQLRAAETANDEEVVIVHKIRNYGTTFYDLKIFAIIQSPEGEICSCSKANGHIRAFTLSMSFAYIGQQDLQNLHRLFMISDLYTDKEQEKHTREKSSINKFSSSLFDQKHSVFRDISGKMTNTQTPPTMTIVVNTTGASVTNTVANHAEKPKKFNGQNFKRWQQKMFFYLTTLGLARFLKETAPQVEPPAEDHDCKTTTAKELWESLERKYKTEDAGTKKFVVARFLDYKMVDSKSVVSQVQDLQVLLHDIHAEGMTLSETFQVAANCKMPKRVNPCQANMVNDDVDMIAMVSDVCAMISEVNLVGTNHGGWWIDTGATRHVCADKSMFHSFRAVDNGQKLYMGNSATADIKGEGDVVLKMTSEKELKLTNVLYVLEIRKNLVSGWLLNKFGFHLVFKSDKFVLSKNQMYVGKSYAMNGMFNLKVMVVNNEINKMNSSAYLIESSNVWHARLGHVNFNSMRRLIKFISIPNCHIDSKYECETYVKAKLTTTSFKSDKRKTEPLDMIHTDIYDLKSLPTKGGNKYFITFIDDCTKYCYVYLLKSKDEAIDKFVLYKTEVENKLGKKIKVVRSDRGGEYVAPFAELCAKHGIRHEFTAPYSPQQNGIAERKNRTLKEMVTAMLISSGMSQDMWGEAILTATYLLNKIPHKDKEETPYEL